MLEPVRLPRPDRVLQVSSLAVLTAVAASGLLATFAGIDLIDQLEWAPACAFRSWTGFECPGCGMTRALVLLGQFQFAASCSAHPAAPGVAIALGIGAARPRLLVGSCRDAVARVALLGVGTAWLVRVL